MFNETVDVERERVLVPEFSNVPGLVARSPRDVTPSEIPEIWALLE